MSDNNDDIRITKELREWAKKPIPVLYGSSVSVFSVVTPIADRIEAEVAQLRQQLIEFMQTNAEWAKKYEDYIELPRDANGRLIRIGDNMVNRDGKRLAVYWIFLFADEWRIGSSVGELYKAKNFIHVEDYKALDTKERIYEDAETLLIPQTAKEALFSLLHRMEELGWESE